MPYVPSTIRNRLSTGKHLPAFMRDFHDQKDLFKAIDGTFEQASGHEINWVDAHIYTIDTFLWFMAAHGYTLQKQRTKEPTLDLESFVQGFTDEQHKRFAEFLMSERNNEQSTSSESK